MATRMQQRRGTAAQWTSADPILAAGEIGFETDTGQFKIGDGTNLWSDLAYFKDMVDLGGSLDDYIPLTQKGQADGVATLDTDGSIPINQLGKLIDGAPNTLDTLNELANGITDLGTYVESYTDTAISNEASARNTAISTHNDDTTNVHGITNTADLATKTYANNAVDTHSSDTTSVHGIADTSALATKTYSDDAVQTHNLDTTNVHGITDTAALATKTYVDSAVDVHSTDTTNVHGIADTSALATTTQVNAAKSDAETTASGYVSTHNAATTNVHGITDTANLVYTNDSRLTDVRTPGDLSVTTGKLADSAVTSAKIADGTIVAGDIADGAITSAKILDETIVNADISATAAISSTKIAGVAVTKTDTGTVTSTMILDGTILNADINDAANIAATKIAGTAVTQADTGTVTSTMIADGTIVNADINASAAIAQSKIANLTTDLASKAPLSAPALTGNATAENLTISGNLTVNGTTTSVSSTNLEVTDPLIYIGTGNSANSKDLGIVGHFNNGTYQHTGITRDATDGKWKLFSGITTEPSDTIDFTTWTKDTLVLGTIEADSATIGNVSNTELQYLDGVTSAIQTQIDSKASKAAPSFTGGVTVDSSGVIFTDGTQTKQGVPSLTSINQQTASYTGVLTDRDKLIEINSASATTLTIPLNSSVAYPVGTSFDILQTGAGQVTIAGASGVTVNATPGLKLRTQWSSATLFKRATDTWVVFGDLSA